VSGGLVLFLSAVRYRAGFDRRYSIDVHPALFEGFACAGFRLAGSDIFWKAFSTMSEPFTG